MKTVERFVRDQKGATLVEYIILVGIVALIAFGGFKAFGTNVTTSIKAQGASVGSVNTALGN
jgi:pilus assembly protein Flp/PilA